MSTFQSRRLESCTDDINCEKGFSEIWCCSNINCINQYSLTENRGHNMILTGDQEEMKDEKKNQKMMS